MSSKGDPTPPAKPKAKTIELSAGKRWLTGILSIGLFVLLGVGYLYHDTITQAAPSCTDGPAGCVVYVDRLPDASLVVALLALATIVGVISATGRLWTFEVSGVKAGPVPDETVAAVPPGSIEEKVVKKSSANHASPSAEPAQVWTSIPVDVRHKADEQWAAWFPGHSLATDVSENIGTGEMHDKPAYYLSAVNPDTKEDVLLRVGPTGDYNAK
jgi:hypothetical protein